MHKPLFKSLTGLWFYNNRFSPGGSDFRNGSGDARDAAGFFKTLSDCSRQCAPVTAVFSKSS